MRLEHPQCSNGTSACLDGRLVVEAPMGEQGWTLRAEGHGRGSVLSVGHGLIEVEVRNGFGLGGVEAARLIEGEGALGRRPSRRQWRGSGWEIEMREDRANGNGIGDEGDDTHGSAARRADEWEDVIDPSDEGCPSRGSTAAWCGSVRRTGNGPSVGLS